MANVYWTEQGSIAEELNSQTAWNEIGAIYLGTTVAGGSSIKTWDGLADASVKTVNGLARASVKTRNGLA